MWHFSQPAIILRLHLENRALTSLAHCSTSANVSFTFPLQTIHFLDEQEMIILFHSSKKECGHVILLMHMMFTIIIFLQKYLSNDEFEQHLGTTREEFYKMPEFKRNDLKRKVSQIFMITFGLIRPLYVHMKVIIL